MINHLLAMIYLSVYLRIEQYFFQKTKFTNVMKPIKLWFLAFLFLPILAQGQNCVAPPAPYVGDARAACGCESATAKAQHRDPLTFQSLPGKTIVWYGNPLHEGTPLPSGVDAGDSNVSGYEFR